MAASPPQRAAWRKFLFIGGALLMGLGSVMPWLEWHAFEQGPQASALTVFVLGLVYLGLALGTPVMRMGLAATAAMAASITASAVISVLLGTGGHSIALAFASLMSCFAVVAIGWMPGLALALYSGTLMLAVTILEVQGWVPGAIRAAHYTAWQRLFGHMALLLCSTLVGWLLSRLVTSAMSRAREREDRFRRLLGIAAHLYWEMDADLRFTQVATALNSSKSRNIDAAVGQHPWDLRQFEFDPAELSHFQATLAQRKPFRDLRVLWLRSDDSERVLRISGEPRFDADGRFAGYWGVGHDTSDDERSRAAQRLSEARYRELFARTPTPLVLHREGTILDANLAAITLMGFPSLAAMRMHPLIEWFEPGATQEQALNRLAQLEQMRVGQSLPEIELALIACDGRRVVVRSAAVRVDADGGLANLSFYTNITEQQQAEASVQRSEALLSHLVATSPDVISLSDLETGRLAMVNATFCRLTGYTQTEVIGRSPLELGLWNRQEDAERLRDIVTTQGHARDVPCIFVSKTGQHIPLAMSAASFSMEGREFLVMSARDVSQTERLQREYRAILDHAAVGIAFTRERRFVQVNEKFEEIFGWPTGSLIDERESVLWTNEVDYMALGLEVDAALARGEAIEVERKVTRRDGSTFLCRLMAQAVDRYNPRQGGTIWTAEDVTRRHEVEAALAKAVKDAESASEAKSAFLANTSHEIRTPLNGLLGLARLARQPGIDAVRLRQYLDQIGDSAQALSDILSDILDLSKIEAGKLHVERVVFDLHALLGTLQRTFGTLAELRGLSLRTHIAGDVSASVQGDAVRLRQILSNFLSNALKFTEAGQIEVIATRADDGEVRIEVHDTGVGIEPATLQRLFRPFTQADESTTRRYGGTGLGLSICRELAALMGGSVGASSEPGQGSCFWVSLPLMDAEPGAADSGFGSLDARPIEGSHVLLVEDNPVNMMVATAMLEQWGIKVTQAEDGAQAIEAVDRAAAMMQPFDVVLMDVQMPVMGGHEATRRLRQRYTARSLPIIALTAAALVSERQEALEAGMNDFLTKPIDADRLRATLAQVLASRDDDL